MKTYNIFIIVPMLLASACKTTAVRSNRDDSSQNSGIKSGPSGAGAESSVAEGTRQELTHEDICQELKSDDFPTEAVADQVRWLCDRGGFATLKSKAFNGQGTPGVDAYFEEHDKTLYYATGLAVSGAVTGTGGFGQEFCEDVGSFREKVGNLGFEFVKSINIINASDSGCEYLLESKSELGSAADLKAGAEFGSLAGDRVFYRVDTMIAPLNYSSLRQYSSLLLMWNEGGQVQGTYLIKAKYNSPGALMAPTRTRVKSTLSATIQGYGRMIK